MFIVVLGHAETAASLTRLPESKFDLYKAATEVLINACSVDDKNGVKQLLQTLSFQNEITANGARIFSEQEVLDVLDSKSLLTSKQCWELLRALGINPPLVKVLAEGNDSKPALFQFTHKSIQEYYTVMSLIEDPDQLQCFFMNRDDPTIESTTDQSIVTKLNAPLRRNLFEIGGYELGEAVAQIHPVWNFSGNAKINKSGLLSTIALCPIESRGASAVEGIRYGA